MPGYPTNNLIRIPFYFLSGIRDIKMIIIGTQEIILIITVLIILSIIGIILYILYKLRWKGKK